jgi:transcriptional regulator with XRE-family HTH domain
MPKGSLAMDIGPGTERPAVGENFDVDLSETQRSRIGLQLGEIRKARNIPQDEAARLIGISRSHLSNIEVGRSRPGWGRLMRMADVYEIGIETLIRQVSGPGDAAPEPPVEARPQPTEPAPRTVAAFAKAKSETLTWPQKPGRSMSVVAVELSPWENYVIEGLGKLQDADRRRIVDDLMHKISVALKA